MAGILIIAHAPLASALREFAAHVYGEVPDRIAALDVMAHEDAKKTLEKALDLGATTYLVKSDYKLNEITQKIKGVLNVG